MQACLQSLLRCSLSYAKIMQTEGRDASLLAIFAEVLLILCKSKTIKTKRQTFNLCFLHSFTQLYTKPRKRLKINTKKRTKKTIK